MTDPAPSLATQNLSVKLGGKPILTGVTVRFEPGRLSAIIGPSGSGKSTLLRCLTSTLRPGDGEVLAGGTPLQRQRLAFRRELGFVPQDDVVHRELKVEQELGYAARLRLDAELGEEQIAARVQRVMADLGLGERRRLRIGRLSGGQRKRVNIAVELLADPKVVLLDEPASGLDPATEEDLLRLLRRLAEAGRTVVLTTHSMEYLDRVDQIVVLLAGQVVFAGDLAALLGHFQIPHVAEMFKTLRSAPAAQWAGRWRSARS